MPLLVNASTVRPRPLLPLQSSSALFPRLLIISTALACAAPVFAAPQPSRYMDVALIAETLAPRPGSSVLVGLKMTPQPGWHGYWSNAGDSGLPPTVRWSATKGVGIGRLQHPAPTLLRVAGLTSYVHAGPHILIARMTIDRTVPLGTPLPITANMNFAVCSDRLCVPQRATLTMSMVAGDAKGTGDARILRRALAKEPKALAPGLFAVEGGRLTLQLPAAARLDETKTRFFPDENGFFDSSKARTLSAGSVRIVSPASGVPPNEITGVVSDGSAAFRVVFRQGPIAPQHPSNLAPLANERSTSPGLASVPPTIGSIEEAWGSNGRAMAPDAHPDQRSRATVSTPMVAAAVAFGLTVVALVWLRRRRR